MLRNYGIIADDPEPALELYFKQCSVLRRLPRPGADGGHAGQRRRQPADRRARGARRVHQLDPERDDHLRHVRLRRRVGLPRRHAGQERRRRRHPRGAARAAGHRRVLAAARRARQQRARRQGVRGDLARPRPALPAAAARGRRPPCARATRWQGVRSKRRRMPAENAAARRATARRAPVYELQGDLRFADHRAACCARSVEAGDALHFAGARLQARRARRSGGHAAAGTHDRELRARAGSMWC